LRGKQSQTAGNMVNLSWFCLVNSYRYGDLPRFQSLVNWTPSWRESRSALWRGLPTKTGSPPQKLYIPGTSFCYPTSVSH